jgi:hypothetical protein
MNKSNVGLKWLLRFKILRTIRFLPLVSTLRFAKDNVIFIFKNSSEKIKISF